MFDPVVICPKMTQYLSKRGHCSIDDKSRLILGGLAKGQDMIPSLSLCH